MKKLVLLLLFLPCLNTSGQGFKVYKSDGKVVAYPGETVKSVTLNDDSLRYVGHEYVDLGLPSGTRWATTNVGAEKDYQNGKHFSFRSAGTDGQWGGDWRLPGIAEYQELLKVCQWEWTRVVNSQGYMVTGPNGNKLFLPAAGHIGADGSYVGGLSGQMAGYWTGEGYSLVFTPQQRGLAANSQALRLSLRPVIGGTAPQDVRSEVVKDGEHACVDLGLSVLWAATNIGAVTPEENGYYFGPGFTEPMPADIASQGISWWNSHNPYYLDNNTMIPGYMLWYYQQAGREEEFKAWGRESALMQYQRLDEMGYWLLPEHDAAAVLWGDGWRMPTLSEFKELKENTTKLTATEFQGPNGSVLTIPRAGYYSNYEGRFISGANIYLTSSILEYPVSVDLGTKSLQYNDQYSNQYYLPVRPVKDRPKAGLTDDRTTAQQEMVDLGLSVLWANCNWGAASPQDKGEYAAWGETFPKADYTSANYHMAGYSGQSTRNLFGKTGWTLPTAADVQELINKCTWAREADGYRVTGPNGNSIFLPYTGFREGAALSYPDETGFYWTSDTLLALRLDKTDKPTVKDATGYIGMAIRPVMPLAFPETVEVQTDWNTATITCKARGSYREAGIQLCYLDKMDSQALGAWCVPADAASLQDGKYTVQARLQPNTSYYCRAYVLTEDSITLYSDIRQLRTTADIPAVDLGLSVKWAPVNLGGTYEYDTRGWFIHPSNDDATAGQLPGIAAYPFIQTTTWPEDWRMPDEAEFQELMDRCTWEWQEGDPVNWSISPDSENRNGYKVTGPNGNSIFLPANGSGDGGMVPLNAGTVGCYWTRTASDKHAGCYNYFKMTATDRKISFGPVSDQYSIRPVKK